MSPLLVLSRNISQKPLHRLRWPEQKQAHRKLLAFSFYALTLFIIVAIIGIWIDWILGWPNLIELSLDIIFFDEYHWKRLSLGIYWLSLVSISIFGWIRQVSRVKNHIQFQNGYSDHVYQSEFVDRLVEAADRTAPMMTLNARRKFFHLLIILIFVPGIIIDVSWYL